MEAARYNQKGTCKVITFLFSNEGILSTPQQDCNSIIVLKISTYHFVVFDGESVGHNGESIGPRCLKSRAIACWLI